MSGTPHRHDGFSLQDLEAPFDRTDDIVRALGHVSKQERDNANGSLGGGALSTWKVVGPGGASGRHLVSPPNSDEVVELPGPADAFRPGSFVLVGQDRNGAVVLSRAPAALAGASGFSVDSPPLGVVEDFKVVSIASDPLIAESTDQPLSLIGYGLRGDETFEAVAYNPTTMTWDADPLVVLHDPSNVDPTQTNILADLAPGVPPTYAIRVRYQRS